VLQRALETSMMHLTKPASLDDLERAVGGIASTAP
jgi:hypothetical protein